MPKGKRLASTVQLQTEGCVSTIADLKALPDGVVPCLAVLSYIVPGDGGGGNFHWDASAIDVEDGGTIITPASNPPTGRWKRLVEGPLSVKWFGAIGDGFIYTAAIRSAAAATAGKTLFFPPGTYKIDGTITISGVGTVVRGSGKGAVLQLAVPNINAFHAPGLDGIAFEDLCLVAAAGDISGNGLVLEGCTDSAVRRCYLSGFGAGILDGNVGGSAILTQGGDAITIDSNVLVGSGPGTTKNQNGIYCADGVGGNANILIVGNDISQTGQGIAAGHLRGVVIANNNIHDVVGPNAQHGMYLATSDATVSDNVVRNVTLCGIKLLSNTNQENITISGNLIDGGWDQTVDEAQSNHLGGGAGVEADGPSGLSQGLGTVNISGNVIANFHGYGVSLGNQVSGVRVSDNIIRSTGSSGIIAQQLAAVVDISRNMIMAAAQRAGSGIEFLAGPGGSFWNVQIRENVIEVANGAWHVYVDTTEGLYIVGNHLRGTAAAGALLIKTSSQIRIFDNIAYINRLNIAPWLGTPWHGDNSWDWGITSFHIGGLANMQTATTTIPCPGAMQGDAVTLGIGDEAGTFPAGVLVAASVSVAGTVQLVAFNATGSTLPSSAEARVRVGVSRLIA